MVSMFGVVVLLLISRDLKAQSFRSAYERGRVDLVEDVAYGCGDDEAPGVLFKPIDFCVDADGNVFVLDYFFKCIKKYSPTGEFQLEFSREGEGPGEHLRPLNLAVTPSGRIITFDIGTHRFSIFDGDGEYVGARNYQGFVGGMTATPDDGVVALFRFAGNNWLTDGMLNKVIRFSADLQTETDVDSAKIVAAALLTRTDETITSVTLPYVANLHFAVSPKGRIVVGRADKYELRLLGADLEPIATIRRDVDPVAITDAHREEYYESFTEDDPKFDKLLRQNIGFPKNKPYFDGVHFDHEGNILVRTSADTESDDTSVYDVFDRSGTFIRQVEMLTVDRFWNGYAYAEKSDEASLPMIVRFKLKGVAENDQP